MCGEVMQGLAGTFGSNDRVLVKEMLSRIRHRGQEDEMILEADGVTLGACNHHLLNDRVSKSIVIEDDIAVVADSYLFNRDSLQLNFLGRIDPEVSDSRLVLELFKLMGPASLNYLSGAFAISILNGKELILARDTYGLRPLYLSLDEGIGGYSSEMKSQQVFGDEFRPFPCGSVFSTVSGFKRINPEFVQEMNDEESGTFLRTLIGHSVAQCLGQGSGVNILLSGGLDSSIVALEAARKCDDVHTLCVGMNGSKDIEMARIVADYLGTDHEDRTYSIDEMVEILDKAIHSLESFDLPLVRSSIPNYIATHSFTDRSRVALCGEGADEIFGGYDHMMELDDKALLEERHSLLQGGHLTGFQRVDRMTSSASLDGRMPFMDPQIVAYGLTIKAKDLVDGRYGLNKISLRRSYRGMLPDEVVQRQKKRFSDGAGSIEVMKSIAEREITDTEFEKETRHLPKGRIRNKEELMYYRIFRKHFGSHSSMNAVGMTPRI
jgi:asparagine synthase (glutamine-hydrolysing)